MGMFDMLRVEPALPGYVHAKDTWGQTKSFDCEMQQLVIDEKGHIYREEYEYELVPDMDGTNRYSDLAKRLYPDGVLKKRVPVEGSYRRTYLTNVPTEVSFTIEVMSGNWEKFLARFDKDILTSITHLNK
jgi:hypothetical protein